MIWVMLPLSENNLGMSISLLSHLVDPSRISASGCKPRWQKSSRKICPRINSWIYIYIYETCPAKYLTGGLERFFTYIGNVISKLTFICFRGVAEPRTRYYLMRKKQQFLSLKCCHFKLDRQRQTRNLKRSNTYIFNQTWQWDIFQKCPYQWENNL